MGGEALLAVVEEAVEVVDQQQVNGVEAQPLQAVFPRAHDAIVPVVEAEVKGQAADPEALLERMEIAGGGEHPADLGREHEVAALLLAEKVAEAVFAFAIAVKRGGVVVADAGVPSRLQGVLGLGFTDRIEKLAQRGTAKAEGAQLDAGAQRARGDGRHDASFRLQVLSLYSSPNGMLFCISGVIPANAGIQKSVLSRKNIGFPLARE